METKKLTKEEKFKKEIENLKIIGITNLKGKNECVIYFKRFIYGKWINSWAKYPEHLNFKKITEIREYMINKGQISY